MSEEPGKKLARGNSRFVSRRQEKEFLKKAHSAMFRALPDVVEALILKAKEGDMRAINTILDRVAPADLMKNAKLPKLDLSKSEGNTIQINIGGEQHGEEQDTGPGETVEYAEWEADGFERSEAPGPEELSEFRGAEGPLNGTYAATVDARTEDTDPA